MIVDIIVKNKYLIILFKFRFNSESILQKMIIRKASFKNQ